MAAKTIGEKLMLKPGQTFLLLKPPAGYKESGALPRGVRLAATALGGVDAIQVFVSSKRELQDSLPRLKSVVNPPA